MTTYYDPPYATPLQRVLAYTVDLLIVLLLSILISLLLFGFDGSNEVGWSLVFLVIHAAYHIGWTVAIKTTPAKQILNLRIEMRAGGNVLPDALILRYLVFLVGYLVPLGLIASSVMVMYDPERRTLHDRIARTIVVIEQR